MDELRVYLKSLTPPEQEAYALLAGTTIGYLRKALSKKPSPQMDGALCRRLDEASGGQVRRAGLRPDIWPELVNRKAPKKKHH